jgi:hypothetical protein
MLMTKINFNERLEAAVKEITEKPDKEKVSIGFGNKKKFYTMVQDRVSIFRKHFGCDAEIETYQTYEPNTVRSETKISIGGEVIANGIAEEKRDGSPINKTSAAEVAETSSIGRALANLSLHGGEYASANEVITAVNEQKKDETDDITKGETEVCDVSKSINLNGGGSGEAPPSEIPEELKIIISNWDKSRHLGELQKRAAAHKEYLAQLSKNLHAHATEKYLINEERLSNGK